MPLDNQTKLEIHQTLSLLEKALEAHETKETLARLLAGYMATFETYADDPNLPNGLRHFHETAKTVLGVTPTSTPYRA